MYFDPRLWTFTRGVRGRIFWAVSIGLISSLLGVGRLALLGWLLGLVLSGAPMGQFLTPAAMVAIVIALRGVTEYWRIMVAHETTIRIKRVLLCNTFFIWCRFISICRS